MAGFAALGLRGRTFTSKTVGAAGARSLLDGRSMNPKTAELQQRTHNFFLRVIKLCETLPESPAGRSISGQLIDSAGGTDSNYRAACRARSTKEFIAKIGVAAEEADESKGWLQALLGANMASRAELQALIQEADELVSIFTASAKTAKQNAAARGSRINN
jgi:four helix bundle protein